MDGGVVEDRYFSDRALLHRPPYRACHPLRWPEGLRSPFLVLLHGSFLLLGVFAAEGVFSTINLIIFIKCLKFQL